MIYFKSSDQTVTITPFAVASAKNEKPLKNTKSDKVKNSKEMKKISAEERREQERAKFYVPYQASDNKAEKVLAVQRDTFENQAKQFSVEISADDDKGLYMEQNRKKW